MSRLDQALADADRVANQMIAGAKSIRGGGGYGGLGSAGAMSNDPFGLQNNAMAQHGEQLLHNRGYVYAIVKTIANRIAGQRIKMARAVGHQAVPRSSRPNIKASPQCFKEAIADSEIVTDHPLLDTLKNPNPYMLPWSMMFFTIASLEITGKAYWWLRKTQEGKYQIWPMPASWVTPKHGSNLYEGWTINPGGFSGRVDIDANEMVYFFYPDPSNPLGALSPLQAMSATVFADESIEESQRRTFLNGCNPGLALTVGRLPDTGLTDDKRPVLTKDQRQTLIDSVKRVYRGVASNDEPLILDGLITDVKKITNTAREMDFISSGQSTKNRLAQGWGVNPISMGEMSSNRAESAVADDHFIANVIRPRIEMFSQALTLWVLPRFGADADLVAYIEQPHSVDQDHDLAVETAMVDRGAMSRDEWRFRQGIGPMVDGDSAIVGHTGANPTVVDVATKPDEAPKPDAGEARSSRIQFRKAATLQLETRRDDLGRDIEAILLEIGEATSATANRSIAEGTPFTESMVDHLISDADWLHVLKSRVSRPLRAAGIAGAEVEWHRHHTLYAGRKSPPPLPQRIIERTMRTVQRLLDSDAWKGVLDAVRSNLKRAVRNAAIGAAVVLRPSEVIADGIGRDTAAAIASSVARTEAQAAMESGAHSVRIHNTESGVRLLRRWKCRKIRSRATHIAADGETVDALTKFTVGGFRCDYPGDPDLPPEERCNCHCSVETLYEKVALPVRSSPARMGRIGRLGKSKSQAVLDVPDIRQEYSYDCGAAATAAVCGYFDLGHGDLSDYIDALGTDGSGTRPDSIVEYLNGIGIDTAGGHDLEIPDLAAAISRGSPIICLVQSYEDTAEEIPEEQGGHYVVVCGADDDTVTVQDPSSGRYKIPALEFLARWEDRAGGKEYTHYGIVASRAD